MRGVLATTKGKYHELIVAHAENTDGDEISARIFEDLNHPGSDIEFIVDGQVIEAVQLKAVVSESLILEHQSRYPDITILATEEAASRVEGVDSSGFIALDPAVSIALMRNCKPMSKTGCLAFLWTFI